MRTSCPCSSPFFHWPALPHCFCSRHFFVSTLERTTMRRSSPAFDAFLIICEHGTSLLSQRHNNPRLSSCCSARGHPRACAGGLAPSQAPLDCLASLWVFWFWHLMVWLLAPTCPHTDWRDWAACGGPRLAAVFLFSDGFPRFTIGKVPSCRTN